MAWIPAPTYAGMITKVMGRCRGLSPPRKRGSTSFLYARWRLCTAPGFPDEITGQHTTRPPNAATTGDLRFHRLRGGQVLRSAICASTTPDNRRRSNSSSRFRGHSRAVNGRITAVLLPFPLCGITPQDSLVGEGPRAPPALGNGTPTGVPAKREHHESAPLPNRSGGGFA